MKHLWEIDHPYYCTESNYFASGLDNRESKFDSWADFIAEWGDADMDYNLLFRFDWIPPKEEDIDEEEDEHEGHTLKIFWMGQRKGLYQWSNVQVTPEDEPAVREFLTERWQHLKKLWEPLS